MEFDWDEVNVRHLARHKVTPEEFEEALLGFCIGQEGEEVNGEDRYREVGATASLRVLFLVYTVRRGRVRPITAWDADAESRVEYFRLLAGSTDG